LRTEPQVHYRHCTSFAVAAQTAATLQALHQLCSCSPNRSNITGIAPALQLQPKPQQHYRHCTSFTVAAQTAGTLQALHQLCSCSPNRSNITGIAPALQLQPKPQVHYRHCTSFTVANQTAATLQALHQLYNYFSFLVSNKKLATTAQNIRIVINVSRGRVATKPTRGTRGSIVE